MEPILTTTSVVFEIIRGNFIRCSKLVATNIHFILRTYKNLLLFFLLLSGFMYRAVFIYKDIEFLTDFWLFEDAFYSLNIAKNIADGSGWTFDGVVPTNGFQPLYVFFMVPVYAVFENDIITPIYVALTFLAVFNVITGYLLYRISLVFTKSDFASILITIIWLFNPAIARNGTNGLETGLSTFLFAMSLFYYIVHIRVIRTSTYIECFMFGLILGCAYLSRIDNILIIILLLIDQFILITEDTKNLFAYINKKILVTFLGFLLMTAPYTAYNYHKFSHLLPSSGAVLEYHPLTIQHFAFNFDNALQTISKIIIGHMSDNGGVFWGNELFKDPNSMIGVFFLLSIITVMVVFTYKYKIFIGHPFVLAAFIYILVFISIYQYQYSNFIFERYFYPVVFIILIIISICLNSISDSKRTDLAIIFMIFIILLASNIYAMEKIREKDYYSIGWKKGTMWLNENLSEYDVVAASQAGNTGYFYKGRVINLDGVVNYDAYKAYKSQRLLSYFTENNITYLADESDWVFTAIKRFNNCEEENILKSRMHLVHKTDQYAYNIYHINHSIDYSEIVDINSELINTIGSWQQYNYISHINNNILMSYNKNDYIQFFTNTTCSIRFLRHPWSGKANIYLNESHYEMIDLYYPVIDPTMDVEIPISKPTRVVIEVSDEKNNKSHGYEVWMDAVFLMSE